MYLCRREPAEVAQWSLAFFFAPVCAKARHPQGSLRGKNGLSGGAVGIVYWWALGGQPGWTKYPKRTWHKREPEFSCPWLNRKLQMRSATLPFQEKRIFMPAGRSLAMSLLVGFCADFWWVAFFYIGISLYVHSKLQLLSSVTCFDPCLSIHLDCWVSFYKQIAIIKCQVFLNINNAWQLRWVTTNYLTSASTTNKTVTRDIYLYKTDYNMII